MAKRKTQTAGPLNGGLLLGWENDKPSARLSGPTYGGPTRGLRPIWHLDDGHLITVAPTGAGKGVSCIIPALLTWAGPTIVIDPKGENYAVTAERRRALGQKVAVLDPFRVTDAEASESLNPLDLVSAAAASAVDDAAVIARLLVQGRVAPRDPFWDERAESLIAGLVLFVAQQLGPSRRLGEVRRLIESSELQIDLLAREMRRTGTPDVVAAANILETRASNTRSGILSTTSSHLSFLRSKPVLASLGESTISLQDVTRGKPLSIFLVIPPDKLVSHAKLLRLWLGVLMTALARRRRIPETPTLLIVDEAAQLGTLDEFRAAVTLMRGYGVKVWSFWQDLSQLIQTYPQDWQSIVNNCTVQQFFGSGSPQAGAALDAYLGLAPGRLSTGLGESEALLVERARTPRSVIRADYLEDRIFRGLAEPNPFYRGRKARQVRAPGRPALASNVIAFPRARVR